MSKKKENIKQKILVVSDFFYPGYKSGGPAKTLANLFRILGEDFEFFLITSDRDLGDGAPYDSIKVDVWNHHENYEVLYTHKIKMSFQIAKNILNHNGIGAVYLNSFFSFWGSIFPLVIIKLLRSDSTRILLAPRGEFSPGALELKSFKKNFYIWISKALKIYSNVIWHASTVDEKKDIERHFHNIGKVKVAIDLSAEINTVKVDEHRDYDTTRICFFSRLSPKKNLTFALDVLSEITKPINFDIIGPVESEAYWKECLAKINKLPGNINVNYIGPIPPEEISHQIAKYDLFLFPTLGENYGHVIAESLSQGVPVLLSDQTPWNDLNKVFDGLVCDLALPNEFVNTINNICELSLDEKLELRSRVLSYIKDKLQNPKDVEDNKRLFY